MRNRTTAKLQSIPRRSASGSMLDAVLRDESSSLPSRLSLDTGIKGLQRTPRRGNSLLQSTRMLLPPQINLPKPVALAVPSHIESVSMLLAMPDHLVHEIVDLLDIKDALSFSSTYTRYADLRAQLKASQKFVLMQENSLSSFRAACVMPIIRLDKVALRALSAKVQREHLLKLPSCLLQVEPLADLLLAMNDFCQLLCQLEGGQRPPLTTNWGQFHHRLITIQTRAQSAPEENPVSLSAVKQDLQRALIFCSVTQPSPIDLDEMADI
jgi:hypothetical protein